jgi:hypothetical protein
MIIEGTVREGTCRQVDMIYQFISPVSRIRRFSISVCPFDFFRLEFSYWLVDIVILAPSAAGRAQHSHLSSSSSVQKVKFYHQPFQKKKKIIVVSTAVLRSWRSRNYKLRLRILTFKT